MNDSPPLLSIIIPAFNEASRLPTTLPQVVEFVQSQSYKSEVIVVDNNSQDQTFSIAQKFSEEYAFIDVLTEQEQGKGAAVKTGMLAAQGEYLFMADADLSMPVDEISKFMPPNLEGYDVAIASRELPGAKRYDEPAYRHLMGRIFNFIVKTLAVHGFQDTQCGFKCFRSGPALDILSRQSIAGWAFDVELLYLSQRLGYTIVEVPINWYYRTNSRIHPLKDAFNMFREVLGIRLKDWRGEYQIDRSELSSMNAER